MILLDELGTNLSPSKPCVLTIGNFDGVHAGHQQILSRMREIAGKEGTTVVLTFSNHPSQILSPSEAKPLIYPKSLKISILDELGIDIIYCLEFTTALAELSYETFLERVHTIFPFDYLILGQGAALGKNRGGTTAKVKQLGESLGFKVEYLSKVQAANEDISSGKIRTFIQEGHLKKAAELLGRPLMFEGDLKQGQVNIASNLCIPPDGSYPITVYANSHIEKGTLHIQQATLKLKLSLPDQKILIFFD